jgi:hypothetical protein
LVALVALVEVEVGVERVLVVRIVEPADRAGREQISV